MNDARIQIRPGYTVSRLIKGGWQLAGGHGPFDRQSAICDMVRFVDSGMTTFDCADIYTGVESMIGEAITRLRQRDEFDPDRDVQIHTKFVPDLNTLGHITHDDIEGIVDRSLKRLNLERLHLVQFYWWDLSVGDPLKSLDVLKRLKQAGKIRYLGCTNWDQHAMQAFVDNEFDMVSAQIQYSLLDQRPAGEFSNWCTDNRIQLFCYGVLAGGFITQYWLDKPDPGFEFDNRSLIKYRLIIEDFGGWHLFQQLLRLLSDIGNEHTVSLSSVAINYMLLQPAVAAVIVGARTAEHMPTTLHSLDIELTDTNVRAIETLLSASQGPDGLVYELERDRHGPHGRIMKYNLNSG